jgi:hypothetical protein
MLLGAAGAAAATCVMGLDFSWRIPGHAILRAVLPIVSGLALVPRCYGGAVMGLSAAATCTIAGSMRAELPGLGAMTSLLAIGPILDASLARIRTPRGVWLALALAGLITNGLAFLVQATHKAAVGPGLMGLDGWWHRAVWSYPICGLVAGLASAVIWFQLTDRTASSSDDRVRERGDL